MTDTGTPAPPPPAAGVFTCATEADTRALAAALAPQLNAGDILYLEGDVGAGKTAFARALIQATLHQDRLPPEDVPSPTFTLVQTYATARHDIVHADLYRLSDPGEALEIGLAEAFEEAVCLIEWPDRLGADRPDGATLRWTVSPDEHRHVTLSGGPLATKIARIAKSVLPQDQSP
ncbi:MULTISPECIES: tRNA (adenosine(37)-N6)-threonylcarbamoyltransferase complex ATPase subunit type 1 TsaE [Jannaschia]|nr:MULTISPECIES: tRNA (adenosine(37)-N6)-threonylcarbamoyltransferase complex ATPase subunit type 1 TsaE [unclassified Jannaschia]